MRSGLVWGRGYTWGVYKSPVRVLNGNCLHKQGRQRREHLRDEGKGTFESEVESYKRAHVSQPRHEPGGWILIPALVRGSRGAL